jgi:hypothetical protein
VAPQRRVRADGNDRKTRSHIRDLAGFDEQEAEAHIRKIADAPRKRMTDDLSVPIKRRGRKRIVWKGGTGNV